MRMLVASLLVLVAGRGDALRANSADWTDRKEYDLVLDIRSETSPQKRLALLETWNKSYPKTAMGRARNELYLNTYEALGDHAHMFETAKQMMSAQPDDAVATYWLTVLTPQQANPTPEVLDAGDKASRKLLLSLDKYFAAEKKPQTLTDAAWQKQRLNVEVMAHRTLGWTNWQRANFPAAAEDLTMCLQKDPGNAEVSSWLGIIAAIDTNKQSQALWHLARATNKDLSTPLTEEQRRQVNSMLENMYGSYHGSMEGIENLRKASASSAFPPPEFALDPATVVNARKAEAELSLTNPELAAWLAMRRQLEAPDGEKYFASDLQSKPLPMLKGTVIKATPLRSPKEIILSMNNSGNPDVTLKLAAPLARPAAAGASLNFQGTGESFTKAPFGLVITADSATLDAKPRSAQ